jgi:hypothetical protein
MSDGIPRKHRRKYKPISRPGSAEDRPESAVTSVRAPPEVLAERDRRNAIDHPDLTSAWCGDPKPGYRALDRVRR